MSFTCSIYGFVEQTHIDKRIEPFNISVKDLALNDIGVVNDL